MRLFILLLAFVLSACSACSRALDSTIEPTVIRVSTTPLQRTKPEPWRSGGAFLIAGQVNDANLAPIVEEVRKAINVHKERNITLVINSRGGYVASGFKFVQNLEHWQKAGVTVTCIVDGDNMSMALYILQGCTRRLATKRSTFMAHEPWQWTFGNQHALRETAVELGVGNHTMAELIALRSKMTTQQYKDKISTGDWTFNWDTAIDLGFVDRIVDPRDIPFIYTLPLSGQFTVLENVCGTQRSSGQLCLGPKPY